MLRNMDQAILEHEAMRLPPAQRALLADALLASLDDEAAREVESAWATEAEERLAAYQRGEVGASDGTAVLGRLRAGLKSA
jgi:L-aminopeptidase/D-esterase-like protein